MNNNVCTNISTILKQNNLTQKDLSLKTGISESAISHYIKGDRIPRGVNLIKIANALNTSTDYLLSNNEYQSKNTDIDIIKKLLARNAGTLTESETLELITLLTQKK